MNPLPTPCLQSFARHRWLYEYCGVTNYDSQCCRWSDKWVTFFIHVLLLFCLDVVTNKSLMEWQPDYPAFQFCYKGCVLRVLCCNPETVMALGASELSADESELAKERSPCISCELLDLMLEIREAIVCGAEICVSDLQAYQVAAKDFLRVAELEPQVERIRIVDQMRILRDKFLFTNLKTERRAAARCALLECKESFSLRCTLEREELWVGGSKAGSKRAFAEVHTETETETEEVGFNDRFGSSLIKCCGNHSKWPGRQSCGGKSPKSEHFNGEYCNGSVHETMFYDYCRGSLRKLVCENYTDKNRIVSMPRSVPISNEDQCTKSINTVLLEKACEFSASGLRWLSRKKRTTSASANEKVAEKVTELGEETVELKRGRTTEKNFNPTSSEVSTEGTNVIGWDSLPCHLQEMIMLRVDYRGLFRFKTLSKSCQRYIEGNAFHQWRGTSSSSEGSFTAMYFYIKNEAWQCTGFDLNIGMWKSLPPFTRTLPMPDAELFKEYLVCGDGGLMCAEISKLPKKGELVVFNPLTGKKHALPSLNFPRSPVVVHMIVNPVTKSYNVIVAGSSASSDEHLSKKIEVYYSELLKWEEAPELPGPAFGLNEHQDGVSMNGVLYFISFLENSSLRGVIAFDVKRKKWLPKKSCPILFSTYSNTLQLVKSNGKLYLFSEQEQGRSVKHCIDVLEDPSPKDSDTKCCHWRNVVTVKKSSGRGLQVYPEFTCVSFGDGKLCIFNTLMRNGVVYGMQDGQEVQKLEPPLPMDKGDNFFTLNPTSFTLQLRFDIDPH